MTKAGERLIRAAQQAAAYARGEAKPGTYVEHTPAEILAKQVRRKLNMSQAQFAKAFHLNLRTLQDWEQCRYEPSTEAKTLLCIIDREPKAALRAMRDAETPPSAKPRRGRHWGIA